MAHVFVNVVVEPQPSGGIHHTVWIGGQVEDETVLANILFARPVRDHGHGVVV